MNPPSFIDQKHELLATAVTLVFASESLRASLFSSAIREMLANTDMELPLVTALVVSHSGMIAVLVVVVAAITLWAIWSRHRLGALMAVVGIICLGIGAQLLYSAAISPVMRMINTMGAQ